MPSASRLDPCPLPCIGGFKLDMHSKCFFVTLHLPMKECKAPDGP